MVERLESDLDVVFAVLSHPARRHTLDLLGRGATSVSDLASPHGMSLAAFIKHVRALEAAGLITCTKQGRTVTCALDATPLGTAADWLSSRTRLWNARLDALGRHLYHREQIKTSRKSKKDHPHD